jgi:hypothetical protein
MLCLCTSRARKGLAARMLVVHLDRLRGRAETAASSPKQKGAVGPRCARFLSGRAFRQPVDVQVEEELEALVGVGEGEVVGELREVGKALRR